MHPDYMKCKRVWGPVPNYPAVLGDKPPYHSNALIKVVGPCSVETEPCLRSIAVEAKRIGATYLRGGVFRAGTYPPVKDFGLQKDKLRLLTSMAKEQGLLSLTEVLDVRQLDMIDTDALQVGARHMQDYTLLKELSHSSKVIFLKRGMGSTLDEFLGAAEYLLSEGKESIVLIERGSSTYHTHVRWELSMSIIAAVKIMTWLPIIVDASHGTGRRDLVERLTLAGIAAGADGYLVETHPCPMQSTSDADQALPLEELEKLDKKATAIKEALNDYRI